MTDHTWPDEAREAVARRLCDVAGPGGAWRGYLAHADDLLAVIRPHAVPATAVRAKADELEQRRFLLDYDEFSTGRYAGLEEAAEELRGLLGVPGEQ